MAGSTPIRLSTVLLVVLAARMVWATDAPHREDTADEGDRGVAPGIVIGITGSIALGDAVESQSPYGFGAMALYPTSHRGHVRLKVGVPSMHNHSLPLTDNGKKPDLNVVLAHEWAGPRGAIGVGLSYLYMQEFALEGRESSPYHIDRDYVADYDGANSFNGVISLRGGRPNGAFYGRFVWPLPYMLSDDEPDAYQLQYSGFGVFGGQRVKCGIGVMGLYKYREADRVHHEDSTYEYVPKDDGLLGDEDPYYDYSLRRTSEFMVSFPCLKLAILFGSHVVVNLDVELGGVIFPREMFGMDSDLWRPTVGGTIVYSFKPLRGVNVMDGVM